MIKYLIFDLDGTLIKSNKINTLQALHCVKKVDENYLEKAKYIFGTTAGMNVFDQLKMIFIDKNFTEKEIHQIGEKIYKSIRKKENEIEFFKGVPEKIKEFSKNYKLFLTTGNSTKFAKDVLEIGGIKECFELIYGSDEIKKGFQHINIFKNYSEDENFYKNSIYFGDGDMDKLFANEANIKFVRIGDFEEDGNEVLDSVKNIDKILKKIKDNG
ncbi:MAG: HAD hydrolase-like protein [Candidatus Gracilibacteria bacterium]|nr:HAD hydrolase-like protein [Candidatus Gracilibacteria bacterium]